VLQPAAISISRRNRSVAISPPRGAHGRRSGRAVPARDRDRRPAAAPPHPALYDSGAAAGFLYYVMPYVEGESLRDRLTREQQLPRTTRSASHRGWPGPGVRPQHGVVHRTSSPRTSCSRRTAVVADFGIAHAVSAGRRRQHLTQTGTIIGTPAYMSPEQATGSAEIDGRSDQYSLACVVYEMLVRDRRSHGHRAGRARRHSLDMVFTAVDRARDNPDAWRRDPPVHSQRHRPPFPTTALFAEALQDVTGDGADAASHTADAAPRRWLECRRRRSGVWSGCPRRDGAGDAVLWSVGDARTPCRRGRRARCAACRGVVLRRLEPGQPLGISRMV